MLYLENTCQYRILMLWRIYEQSILLLQNKYSYIQYTQLLVFVQNIHIINYGQKKTQIVNVKRRRVHNFFVKNLFLKNTIFKAKFFLINLGDINLNSLLFVCIVNNNQQ